MTGLVGWVAQRQIAPGGAGTKDPKDHVKQFSRVPPSRAYARVSGVFRVRRFLADLLCSVGFSVNLGRTQSVSYQGSAAAEEERVALRALLPLISAWRSANIYPSA